MASATTDRDLQWQPSEIISYTGASGYLFYKGTIAVQQAGTGAIRPYTAGLSGAYFLGIVRDRVDQSAGLGASQAELKIYKRGEVTLAANGTGVSAHIGRQAFAIDDQTVGVSATVGPSSIFVGEIVGVPTSTTYRVRIDNAVGTRGNSGVLEFVNNAS